MHLLNLVSVYEDRSVAEEVRHKLLADGIPEDDIRVSADTGSGAPGRMTTASGEQESGGFFSWLFNLDGVSDGDRTWYGHHLEKRTAVSVRVEESEAHRVRDILDSCDPFDFGAEPATEHRPTAPKMTETSDDSNAAPISAGKDTVIPLVQERLDVGKETVEMRHRVRTYVVERPVEKTIPLRDERGMIERQPVSGQPSSMAGAALEGREFDVVERHERPAVDKKAAATEEVVIHKEVGERTETVRDTIRELEVDDEAHREDRPALGRDDAGRKS